MCNPTTGSPTITLFQLRSNYHAGLKEQVTIYLVYTQPKPSWFQVGPNFTGAISEQNDSSSVMGGVCKVWYSIHRNILICDY